MNTTYTMTLTGFRSKNATVGLQNKTTIETDNTEGRNSSKLVNVDTITEDLKTPRNASSVLFMIKSVAELNFAKNKPESHTKDNNGHKSTTGLKVPHSMNERTVASVPFRDWRQILQVMPKMEDYLSTWPKSKIVSSHDRMTKTSFSVSHEKKPKFH